MIDNRSRSRLAAFLALILATIGHPPLLDAAQLTLTWSDNSPNEDGFNVERRVGTAGTYGQLGSVGVNVNSYADGNLLNSTTYCYRARSYNLAGSSGYSNEGCATTAAATTSYTLTVSKSGPGTGTVTATGINCGADCSEVVTTGTSVVLTAAAASGSTFAGWSGGGCTGTGTCTVSMSAATTVTATFNAVIFSLTVNKSGTGSGTVTGTGINCGADCSEPFASGTSVVLTAVAASGSTFAGWTGTGCALRAR